MNLGVISTLGRAEWFSIVHEAIKRSNYEYDGLMMRSTNMNSLLN